MNHLDLESIRLLSDSIGSTADYRWAVEKMIEVCGFLTVVGMFGRLMLKWAHKERELSEYRDDLNALFKKVRRIEAKVFGELTVDDGADKK